MVIHTVKWMTDWPFRLPTGALNNGTSLSKGPRTSPKLADSGGVNGNQPEMI